ncbi:MAG: hypothetical protein LIO75_05365 [Lachnospiraceae bacterium]|nr:hypothetical protein [Lachnospiraceae bacterium]
MGTDQIMRQIRRYESRIESLQKEIRELEQDNEELELLAGKYRNLQSSFEAHQSERKNALSVLEHASNMNSVSGYCRGMHSLLNGSEFSGAYNGISESISKIRKKQRQAEEEISICRSQINAYSTEINQLECAYQKAVQAEA